jgi:apolipoprotein N-acyltransferase
MGLFWGIFSWARGRIMKRWPQMPDALLTPVLWVAVEYGRSSLPDIDFPWALLGSSQFLNLHLLQSADLFGVWTLSFLVAAVNAAVAGLLDSKTKGALFGLLQAGVVTVLVLAALGYGALRLDGQLAGGEIRTAAVQGNIEQDVKWDPAFKRATYDLYARLSREAAAESPDLIVWPETAAPFFFAGEPRYQEEISALARETGAALLFGSPGREGAGKPASLRNRAYLVAADGELQGWYDKVHLVPFGEYVPWKRLLFFVDKLVEAVGEFSPGDGPRLLEVGGKRFGTLICYEIIFPDLVRRNVRQGADFLVNITNDAWFGRTAASRQHFSALALRAVENRRPVVRAANTGISGFVDTRGRILVASDLFTRGHYGAVLQLSHETTLYTRMGDALPMACAAVAAALLLADMRRGKRGRRYSV